MCLHGPRRHEKPRGDFLVAEPLAGQPDHVEFGWLGYHTVTIARGAEKEELARSLGADDYIDSAAVDPGAALPIFANAKGSRRAQAQYQS
jgi:hypothetical protein